MQRMLQKMQDSGVSTILTTHLDWDSRHALRQSCVAGRDAIPSVALLRTQADLGDAIIDPVTGRVQYNAKWDNFNLPPAWDFLASGVKKVCTNACHEFIALKHDGSAHFWGLCRRRHRQPPKEFLDELAAGDFKSILSSMASFSCLKENERVIAWGSHIDKTEVKKLRNIESIWTMTKPRTRSLFVGIKRDGTIVTWGVGRGLDFSRVEDQLYNVKYIAFTQSGVSALTSDGRTVMWGNEYGWDPERSPYDDGGALIDAGFTRVKSIVANLEAFAGIQDDGRVVTWGFAESGGDSSAVQHLLTNIARIQPGFSCFHAHREDGQIVSWGYGHTNHCY